MNEQLVRPVHRSAWSRCCCWKQGGGEELTLAQAEQPTRAAHAPGGNQAWLNRKCQQHHGSGNEAKGLWSLQWNNLWDHCQRLVSVDGCRSLCTPAYFLNRKYLNYILHGEIGESGRYLQLSLFWSAGGATARWSERKDKTESWAVQWRNPNTVFLLATGVIGAFVPWRWDHGCYVTDRVAWWRIHSAHKGHRSDFLSELWAGPQEISSILSGAALSLVSVYVLLAFWGLYLCEKQVIVCKRGGFFFFPDLTRGYKLQPDKYLLVLGLMKLMLHACVLLHVCKWYDISV